MQTKTETIEAARKVVEALEAEFIATRATLVAKGEHYYGHPVLRSLIARIDRMRREVAKLAS